MDNNPQTNLSNQTEIPVSDINPKPNSSSGFDFSKVKVKTLGAIGLLIVLIVVVAVLFLIKPGGIKPSPSNPIYSKAQSAANQGKYEDAKKLYANVLTAKKNDPVALSGIITSISQQGNQTGSETNSLKESQPYIDQALQSNPNDPNILTSAGYAYETAGDYQKAFSYYDQAVKAAPKSDSALFHRGHVEQFLGKSDDAQKDYDAAFALNPNNPQVLIMRGNMFASQGKLQEAYDSFKKASEKTNDSQMVADSLTAAATVRRQQNNFAYMSDSLTLSKEAVDADPTFSPALAAYGYNLFITGDQLNGLNYLKKAIDANPRISKNYAFVAYFSFTQKNYGQAINYQKQAISALPNDNTLLGSGEKKLIQANYDYQLAFFYSAGGQAGSDELSLLSNAVSLNPSLKSNLQQDYNRGLFKELAGNNDFLSLLK